MTMIRGTYAPLPEAGYPYPNGGIYPAWRCLIIERARGAGGGEMLLACGAVVYFTPEQVRRLATCYSAPCPRCTPDPGLDDNPIIRDPEFSGYYHMGPHSNRPTCCRYATAADATEAWRAALANPAAIYDMIAAFAEHATNPLTASPG